MGRKKTAQLNMRFTPEEKEKIISKSKEARMTVSQYIRTLSEQKKIIVTDEVPELCIQVVKIGTNINQVAAVANRNQSVSKEQIDLLNTNLIKIQNMIGKLIDTIQNSDDDVVI